MAQCLKSDKIKVNPSCFTVLSAITGCWHTKLRHVRYVKFGDNLQKRSKSIANRRVEDLKARNGYTKYTTRLFHGPWHDPVGQRICAQPFGMWNRLRFKPFLQVSQISQKRKGDANKQDFEMLNLKC